MHRNILVDYNNYVKSIYPKLVFMAVMVVVNGDDGDDGNGGGE